jgi:GT2 family glycosyltransferase
MAAGAAALDTDLLLFLHADTLPEAGALAALRRAFADPSVGRSAMVQRIDADGRFYRGLERTASRRARRGLVYGDSGLCLRREVYHGVGGFRDIPIFEDLDLARRLMAWPVAGRMVLVEDAVLRLSARRWRKEGPLRCTLRNWTLARAWRMGVSPERLARFYPPHPSDSSRPS